MSECINHKHTHHNHSKTILLGFKAEGSWSIGKVVQKSLVGALVQLHIFSHCDIYNLFIFLIHLHCWCCVDAVSTRSTAITFPGQVWT